MDITSDQGCALVVWTSLLLILCSCSGVTNGRVCEQGYIEHYKPGFNSEILCCKPIRCGRGHRVVPCTENRTADTCEACQRNRNQSLRTSSYTMDECSYWPLNDACRDSNNEFDIHDARTKDCACDIENGLRFTLPEIIHPAAHKDVYCQQILQKCLPGHEPTLAGVCTECKPNYFKNISSFKLCEPKTNCSKLGLQFVYKSDIPTKDNKCAKPVPVTTTARPKIPDAPKGRPSATITTTTTTTTIASTVPNDFVQLGSSRGTRGRGGGGESNDSHVGPILGTVLFLVIVVVIIAVILFYRKRRGLSFCCGTVKTCSDPEKNMRHTSSLMAEPHQRNKIILGSSSHCSGAITSTAEKVMNNNTTSNGRLPHYMARGAGEPIQTHSHLPARHVNFQSEGVSGGGMTGHQDPRNLPMRQASFPGEDYHQQTNDQMFPPAGMYPPSTYPPSPGHNQHMVSTSPRQGILRNGGPGWQYGQARGLDQTLDSIMREKLQVQMLGREANMEAGGESDPLLVSETPHHAHGARAARVNAAMPGVLHGAHYQNTTGNASASPPLMQGRMGNRQYLPHQPPTSGGSSSSSGGPEVTFAPAPQTTYVHPPGVVATFTRSSSVIATPEGEVDEDDMEARVPRFSQLLPDMDGGENTSQAGASPDRDDQEVRRPDESGTTQQMRTPNQRLLPRQPNHPHPMMTTAQGRLPTPRPRLSLSSPTAPVESAPDHHIMNLKEQQLEESLRSSSSLNSQLKMPSDLSETEALKTMTSAGDMDEPYTQETTLKTHRGPSEHRDFTRLGNKQDMNEEPASSEEKKRHVAGGGVGSHPSSDPSVQTNPMAARDRRRMASGGNGTSPPNTTVTQERHRNHSAGDQPRPNSTTAVKVPHSQTVTCEEDEENTQPYKQCEMQPEAAHPEKNAGSEQKEVAREGQASSGCGTHSAEHSPSRSNKYQRSQSENTASGSESPHRPPPRSNSEEKPQSSNRPVAKVRPMPASDGPLPVGILDSARSTAGQGNLLSYSSEEDDSEDEEAASDFIASLEVDAEEEEEEEEDVVDNRGGQSPTENKQA